MNWLYDLTKTDFFFIGAFIALYGLYIFRTFWLARHLNTSAWGVIPKFFLRGWYFALLMIALMGPSFGDLERDLAATGHDVYLVVDVSRSMGAADVIPTRLERVKFDIQHLADTLRADRFGLILAASRSLVLSPLTTDHDAFNQLVRTIRPNSSAGGGTDLCAALELARQKFLTDSSTRQSARALVLFSDGENFSTCETATMARLRAAGLSLTTVGVGTEAGSSIREGTDFVRDEGRQIVRSQLNRSFMQTLARDGRGQYIEVDRTGQYVNVLADWLRSQRGRTIDQNRIAVSANKYTYFLLAALGLIALDLLITFRTFRL
ncbi:hypothetical protein GCM10027578_15710 [Spirosoma luteolum]